MKFFKIISFGRVIAFLVELYIVLLCEFPYFTDIIHCIFVDFVVAW